MTWRGRIVVGVLLLALFLTVLFGVYPFLAPNNPFADGPVVAEGWGGPNLQRAAIAEFRRHDYPVLLFTGEPIDEDSLFYEYGSYANLGRVVAEKVGLEKGRGQSVPGPKVERDRTFASAQALRQWLEKHGPLPNHLTLVSMGVHSRRSRELFQKALGPEIQVGVVAVPATGFDSKRWWTNSEGFRTVTDEAIAYTYVTVCFWRW